jgi:acetyl-CoA C-acetyltransferase
MAELLVQNPGSHGLITANGSDLTKHAFGVYSTEPPTTEFRWQDVQAAVDREPARTAAVEWEGVGTVES